MSRATVRCVLVGSFVLAACTSPRSSLPEPQDAGLEMTAPPVGTDAGAGGPAPSPGPGPMPTPMPVPPSDAGVPETPAARPDVPAVPPSPAMPRLEVTVIGGGPDDEVTGFGIQCPGTCTTDVPLNAEVDLVVHTGTGTTVVGWTGDCSGTGNCHLVMNGNKKVTLTLRQHVVWQKTFGGVQGLAINQDDLFVAGGFEGTATFVDVARTSKGRGDAYMAKVSADGQLGWVKVAGTADLDNSQHVAAKAGEAAFTVYTLGPNIPFEGQTQPSSFVAIYSSAGTLLRTIPQPLLSKLKYDPSGALVVSASYPTLLKYNGGTRVWTRSDPLGYIEHVAIDAAGDVYVATMYDKAIDIEGRSFKAPLGQHDAIAIKYSSDGKLIWATAFGANGMAYPSNVVVDASGFYVAGSFTGTLPTGSETRTSQLDDAFLLKFAASDGRRLWAKIAGSTDNDFGSALVLQGADVLLATSHGTAIDFGGGPSRAQGGSLLVRLNASTGAFVRQIDLPVDVGEMVEHASGDLIVGGSQHLSRVIPP